MALPASTSTALDPPLPHGRNLVGEMSIGKKLKIMGILLAAAVVCGGASWFLLGHGRYIWGTILGAVGLFCLVAGLGPKNWTAACPHCGADIDTIDAGKAAEGKPVRCDGCSEYSTVTDGMLHALDPAATSADKVAFESPAFRGGSWPDGCVACGAPPVRFEDVSKLSVGGPELLLGGVGVSRGSVKGVPYCGQHKDLLALKVDVDKKLRIRWASLRMMRRYLAANRGRPVV